MTTLRELTEKLFESNEQLHMYKTELDMQNENLTQVQIELEESRKKYFDLYELSPIGFVTLATNYMITECNLMFASLANMPRTEILGHRFEEFVCKYDQDKYYLEFRKLSASTPVTCNIHIGDNHLVYIDARQIDDEYRLIVMPRTARKGEEA